MQSALRAGQQSYADLRQLSDQLGLALAEARQTGSQHQAVLDDLASSAAALSAERQLAEQRAEQARHYCHAVRGKLQASQLWEGEKWGEAAIQCLPSRSVAELLSPPSAAQLSFGEAFSDAGSSALDVVSPESAGAVRYCRCRLICLKVNHCSCSPAAEERLLLMQDVEALYAEATATQEKLVRRRQHLANQRAAAEALLVQRAQQAAQLDADIEALRSQRGAVESALESCNATLRASYSNVQEQVHRICHRTFSLRSCVMNFISDRAAGAVS
jgi:chromosome segregation ATPase